jgi:hypothetical protein
VKLITRLLIAGFLVLGFLACTNDDVQAQDKENIEDVTVPTIDGLRLIGQWFPGGQGRQSDCVIMVHGYQNSTQKGPWAAAAKALQAKGFSVLVFDLRGHGRSTTGKTIHDSKLFANRDLFPFNRFSGTPSQHEKIKGIDVKSFNQGYYPYLIHDLTAARRFLDTRNDAGECNSGRIHLIVDRDSAALALLWTSFEWLRNGINPAIPGQAAPNHNAGSDIVSMIFLSPKPCPNASVRSGVLTAVSEKDYIYGGLREKVAMAFVVNTELKESTDFASTLYSRWRIKQGQKDDPELGKYLIEVKGAKLSGIDLMDDKLDTLKQILSFITATKKKNVNGNDWKTRNATVVDQALIPLEKFNVR